MADYSTYEKTELLKIIAKQEKELKAKKYGLVWDSEREPEQVVLDCENNLPILKRIKGKEIRTDDSDDNILIEGDNYHALTVLNYTHKEKIDVIYIDPPYNTGKDDFIYNDRFVEKEDGYRHSKWLNFMEKRLKLAKELLTKDGVIFISIDDNEQAGLKLLCDMVLGENNNIGTIIQNKLNAKNDAGNIQKNHEYILVYKKECQYLRDSNSKIKPTLINYEFKEKKIIKKSNKFFYINDAITTRGEGGVLNARPNLGYTIYYNPKTEDKIGVCDYDINLAKSSNDLEVIYKTDKSFIKRGYQPIRPPKVRGKLGAWTWSIDKFNAENNSIVITGKEKAYSVKKRIFVSASDVIEQDGQLIYRVYSEGNSKSIIEYSTNEGTNTLTDVLGVGCVFNNPKNTKMIEYLISLFPNKNSIILDFMAGSGTTGHSVLGLNKKDGGKRKFILCTNNENNICTKVTYPRVKNIIKGYGFNGKDETNLYEKKLTWTDFYKKSAEIILEINDLIKSQVGNYDIIEKEFKNNVLKIIGIKNIDGKKDGLGGNLQYFKTALIKKTKNRDQVKINLTQKCTEMLCVKENIFNLETKEEDFKIFSSNKKDKFLCIYYNYIEDSFANFIEQLKKIEKKKIIYMFSPENDIDKTIFNELSNKKIESIPHEILAVYKQLVKMNIPIKSNVIFTDFNKAKSKIFADKDKDDGARVLRVVLEKLIQKISQDNSINILNAKGKEEKISVLNDKLFNNNVINKVEYLENRTCLTIGNNAAHGDYGDYSLEQVEKFYKHTQTLLNSYNI